MSQFGRVAKLEVDGRLFSVNVAFEVEKTNERSANKATIKAYNLSPASRSYIEAKGRVATLSAGYRDSGGPALIFNGTVSRSANERSGPDIITSLECSDGETALRFALADVSFEEGVTDKQVLEKAIALLREQGLGRGFVADFTPLRYSGGYCFSGSAAKLMDEVCSKRDLTWSIQDGLIQVIAKGLHTNAKAVLLSAATGLVGFPSKKDELMTAKALLNPNVAPGRQVQLKSVQTSLNGYYVVNKAKYVGDLQEAEFTVEIEASLVKR